MMYWTHGYDGGITSIIEPDTGLIVTKVKDWAGQNQDLDETSSGFEPLTGVYTINGHPTWSFGDGQTGRYIRRNSTMKKSNGVPITTSEVRTMWHVCQPNTFTDPGVGFAITGGPLFNFDEGPYFQPLFDMESFFHVNGWYLFDTAWRFDGGQIQGPDTPRTVYEGKPTIVTCIGAPVAGSLIKVYVNGVHILTTPLTSAGVTGPSQTGFISGNCRQVSGAINLMPFQGPIAEEIGYDYDQSTAPLSFAKTLNYLKTTYTIV